MNTPSDTAVFDAPYPVPSRDEIIEALSDAIALNQLSLFYQPQADLQTGKICGVESLLRWQHPRFGNIPPARFIPLAEESLHILEIGVWVVRRACQDIRSWLDKGIVVPPVAVNISPVQLSDDLVRAVQQAIDDYRICADSLELEVTEGALMGDIAHSERVLTALKGIGLKLSLDDFGTGYSSLSYLKRYPFDRVKIDQSFVRELATSDSDQTLVKVIVSMSHGLGMRVIAEGVETEAQCDFLRESVCDEIQGYYFSKPINAEAAEAFLSSAHQLPAHLLRMRKPQHTLMLVDDEPNILSALHRVLRPLGFKMVQATGPTAAIDILEQQHVDIIISDHRMPGMTGVEFFSLVSEKFPDTTRILLTGYAELDTVINAVNKGSVYRFLSKPWDDADLLETLRKVKELKDLIDENKRLQIEIHTANHELVTANRLLRDKVSRDHTIGGET